MTGFLLLILLLSPSSTQALPGVGTADSAPTQTQTGPSGTQNPTTPDSEWDETDDRDLKDTVQNIHAKQDTIKSPTAKDSDKDAAQHDLPHEFDHIEQLSDKHPNSPVAQEKITEAYEDVDELHRAVAHVDRYVELERKSNDPERLDKALDARGGLLLNLGDKKAAAANAMEALKLRPNDQNARLILALAQSKGVGNIDLSKINKPDASGTDSLAGRYGSDKTGKNSSGSTALLSNADQGTVNSASADALRYIGLGDFPAAVNSINTGLKKVPNNARLLALRAQAELGEGKPSDALADAAMAVLYAPKLGEAYLSRAKAEEALSYPANQIIADYQQAKELDASFTADYETALARLHDAASNASNPNSQVDSNGIGMAGRKGLGFNPQAARDQLFAGLPAPVRKFVPIAIILFMAGLIAGIAAWLKRQSQP